jgi:hypothetical protein
MVFKGDSLVEILDSLPTCGGSDTERAFESLYTTKPTGLECSPNCSWPRCRRVGEAAD